LCEAVSRPTPTGEAFVLRAFDYFEVVSSPRLVKPFTVWMQLRNGNGAADMLIVMDHIPPAELDPVEVIAVQFSLQFSDPNQVVEHEAIFENGLLFEVEGRYRLTLLANGACLMQRDFTVVRTGT
jgi:hypothetical protein